MLMLYVMCMNKDMLIELVREPCQLCKTSKIYPTNQNISLLIEEGFAVRVNIAHNMVSLRWVMGTITPNLLRNTIDTKINYRFRIGNSLKVSGRDYCSWRYSGGDERGSVLSSQHKCNSHLQNLYIIKTIYQYICSRLESILSKYLYHY